MKEALHYRRPPMDSYDETGSPNDYLGTLICFEITGQNIGRCISCVTARDVETARARTAPLFNDCELTPLAGESLVRL
jgi:hypothetical protein